MKKTNNNQKTTSIQIKKNRRDTKLKETFSNYSDESPLLQQKIHQRTSNAWDCHVTQPDQNIMWQRDCIDQISSLKTINKNVISLPNGFQFSENERLNWKNLAYDILTPFAPKSVYLQKKIVEKEKAYQEKQFNNKQHQESIYPKNVKVSFEQKQLTQSEINRIKQRQQNFKKLKNSDALTQSQEPQPPKRKLSFDIMIPYAQHNYHYIEEFDSVNVCNSLNYRRKSCHCEECGKLTKKERNRGQIVIEIVMHKKQRLANLIIQNIKSKEFYSSNKQLQSQIQRKQMRVMTLKKVIENKAKFQQHILADNGGALIPAVAENDSEENNQNNSEMSSIHEEPNTCDAKFHHNLPQTRPNQNNGNFNNTQNKNRTVVYSNYQTSNNCPELNLYTVSKYGGHQASGMEEKNETARNADESPKAKTKAHLFNEYKLQRMFQQHNIYKSLLNIRNLAPLQLKSSTKICCDGNHVSQNSHRQLKQQKELDELMMHPTKVDLLINQRNKSVGNIIFADKIKNCINQSPEKTNSNLCTKDGNLLQKSKKNNYYNNYQVYLQKSVHSCTKSSTNCSQNNIPTNFQNLPTARDPASKEPFVVQNKYSQNQERQKQKTLLATKLHTVGYIIQEQLLSKQKGKPQLHSVKKSTQYSQIKTQTNQMGSAYQLLQ